MRQFCGFIAILACLSSTALAGETQPTQEYAAFSRLVHKFVVKQLPKKFEDNSGWGQMSEVPANIRFAALRKIVKVDDHLEAPHGAWRRFMGKIEDPDKNLKIVVKDFKKLDERTYRITVEVEATVVCHGEWQQWQKGLLLISAEASADADFKATIVCEVGVSPNFKKFPLPWA